MIEKRIERRRFLAGSMVALGAALLAGCAGKPGGEESRDGQSPAEETAVTVLMPGPAARKDKTRSSGFSALTRERLGFSVQVEQVPRERYETTLWQRMMGPQTADLFYLPVGQSMGSSIYEDCLAPLSALLCGHEALYQAFTPRQWDCRRYYRIVYAVPARTSDCYQLTFWARADLLEKLGADPAAISDWDDLQTLLVQVKQKYPQVVPVVPDLGLAVPCLLQDPLNDDLGVLLNNQGTEVVNWYSSEEYTALCRRMYQWSREKLILQGACLRTEPADDLMAVYNGFGYFAKTGGQTEKYLPDGTHLTALPMGPPLLNSSGLTDSWALPVHECCKEEALELLELLYTDAQAARLFAEEPNWREMSGEDRTAAARVSPAYGFVFNEMSLLTKISACKAVVEQYHSALLCGYLDPDEALPRFLSGLQDAGIEDILANKQRQLDDWLRAQR